MVTGVVYSEKPGSGKARFRKGERGESLLREKQAGA
tara:strand:+ start:95803 stop:95910 length:108 start_codon:yes stop_codon:yes gene_type:complete